MLSDIRLQMARAGLPVIGGIAYAAGEEDEFVGVGWWKDSIFGVATDHAQAVDEHADKEVGLAERLAVLPRDKATVDEGRQRLHGVGGAQDRESMAMHDLEVLHGILDIDDTAGAMLQVDGAVLHQLLELLPAQGEGLGDIPGFSAIDVAIAMGLDALAKSRVAGHMPQFDQ